MILSKQAFCSPEDTLGNDPLVSAERCAISYGWYDRRPYCVQNHEPLDRNFRDMLDFRDGSTITYHGDFSVTITYPDGRPDKVISYSENFYPNGDKKPVINTEIPHGSGPEVKHKETPTSGTNNPSVPVKNWSFQPFKSYLSGFWKFVKKAFWNLGKTRETVYAPAAAVPAPDLPQAAAAALDLPEAEADGVPIETLCIQQINAYLVENPGKSFSNFLHETLVFCAQNCPAESRYFAANESVLEDINSEFNVYMNTLVKLSNNEEVPAATREILSIYQLSLETISRLQVHSASFTLWLNNNPEAMEMYCQMFLQSAQLTYGDAYVTQLLSLFPPK